MSIDLAQGRRLKVATTADQTLVDALSSAQLVARSISRSCHSCVEVLLRVVCLFSGGLVACAYHA